MTPIRIPRTIVNQILSHAQSSPESEVCGLIGAANGEPRRVYPVANAARRPDALFQMDPREQVDAMRSIREADQSLFAIYHSHPHAPALPSPIDLEEASYPEVLYLIVSLDTKGVLEMRGFRLREGRAEDVQLEVL
ncbi:Mov34/MPN/PAD-1 family protein [Thiohalomonas denitrificans]|uniref:Proteasome lid subunit RPN8/RPN11, contains Jab1/MPN metalloenzyme (JAMM) motif n=1 Tax=Thiohalomonas denitrificans TaxID=415747 RepID=A0A1G5Q7P9_9GAMM|nr:M67 family metallopeptidase [Thiohalomonas denitrificans]SCZ57884.1 Proteasome lid subunit RPN8/RPN11, contains Jab1/MPN metalloenzyme (JAMM) motif [Thiohalomonas denitrificans]